MAEFPIALTDQTKNLKTNFSENEDSRITNLNNIQDETVITGCQNTTNVLKIENVKNIDKEQFYESNYLKSQLEIHQQHKKIQDLMEENRELHNRNEFLEARLKECVEEKDRLHDLKKETCEIC